MEEKPVIKPAFLFCQEELSKIILSGESGGGVKPITRIII